MKPLLTLDESLHLSPDRVEALFSAHISPSLLSVYRILGVDRLSVTRAEGVELHLADGRVLLDFSSAIGILGLGHHHPRIDAAEATCKQEKILEAIKLAPQPLAAALAYNLAALLPDPLAISFFTVSGAEAVEAALKLCERAQGPTRRRFVVTVGAYHGKTHTALSLSRTEHVRESFIQGIPESMITVVPYGDAAVLHDALDDDVVAVIVEPIQGQGVRVPPDGYLKNVVKSAHAAGALVIFDEVKVGMGRTGTFCAFQHEEVVPDVVTLSKALGGGTRAIGAMVTSDALFQKAYGKKGDSGLHSTTFGGLGTSCAVAIEVLNIIGDPAFLAAVREKGEYLRERLETLCQTYPNMIRSVRGRGLFHAIEFNFRDALPAVVPAHLNQTILDTFDKGMMAGMIRLLHEEYGILAHFSASDVTTLHLMPPLIVTKEQLDQCTNAITDILRKGFGRLLGRTFREQLSDLVR